MGFIEVFHRRKWPVVLPLHDGRQCPVCSSVVRGPHGQRTHQAYHDELAGRLAAVEEELDIHDDDVLDGYVLGEEHKEE